MDLEAIKDSSRRLKEEVGKSVVGQDRAIDLLLVSLLCDGHILFEGVPGTAKTLLVQSFAAGLPLDFGRIQFTPDLMPGDVIGTNLFNFQTNEFTLTKGPVFTQLLLADDNAWRFSARELIATVAVREGRTAAAVADFRTLTEAADAPPGVRARAQQMLNALGEGG